jgi:hypothetical protein
MDISTDFWYHTPEESGVGMKKRLRGEEEVYILLRAES